MITFSNNLILFDIYIYFIVIIFIIQIVRRLLHKDSMSDKTTLPALLGKAIERVRLSRGMTKYRLAKLTNTQPQRISQIEGGMSADLRLTSLLKICTALECSPGELLDEAAAVYTRATFTAGRSEV